MEVDLDKLIVAKAFKKLPKVQNIARSGHTASLASHWLVTAYITALESSFHIAKCS